MSEKLGHVRVAALRQFIKKNNNFFKQRKIMTLRKQEAIDVINNGLSKSPESVLKEWNRLKTMKGEPAGQEGPTNQAPIPRKTRKKGEPAGQEGPTNQAPIPRKTRKKAKPEEAMPPKKLVQLEKQFKTKPVSEGVPQRRAKTPTRKRY